MCMHPVLALCLCGRVHASLSCLWEKTKPHVVVEWVKGAEDSFLCFQKFLIGSSELPWLRLLKGPLCSGCQKYWKVCFETSPNHHPSQFVSTLPLGTPQKPACIGTEEDPITATLPSE